MIVKRNINEVEEHHQNTHENFEYYKKDLIRLRRAEAKQCKVSHYSIPPGKSNYPYHYHLQNEEIFYIISGEGIIKTPDGDIAVCTGDTVYFPADESGAHKLTNTSDSEPLVYLDFDTSSTVDVCLYPETNKIGIYGNGLRQIHNKDIQVDYYDGE